MLIAFFFLQRRAIMRFIQKEEEEEQKEQTYCSLCYCHSEMEACEEVILFRSSVVLKEEEERVDFDRREEFVHCLLLGFLYLFYSPSFYHLQICFSHVGFWYIH